MAHSEAELAEVETIYRKTVRDAFEFLTFKGLTPTGQPVSLPLEEVYVGLKLLAEVPDAVDELSAAERRLLQGTGRRERLDEEQDRELDSLRYRRWREEARGEQPRLQRWSLDATQVELDEPVMVLLGDPGSGKTTLLHYLALRASAPEQIGGTRKGRLPIFVSLAAYDEHLRRTDDTATLEQFLSLSWTRWRNPRGLEPLFHQALEEGRALVLLDGLDEVLELTTRRHVAEQVSGLLHKWEGRGNRFVLTSRFIGYREVRLPGTWPHYMVLDFGPEEMERFARKWCESFEVLVAGGERSEVVLKRARQEARALLVDVHSKPGVAHLASNPLLLKMLAQLRRQEGQLPARRMELYDRYVRGVLEHWAERVEPDVAQQHLMDLALWLQRHRPGGTARQGDLVKVLRHQEMRDIAGLLGERGHDAHGFLHLTFQEYFVGRALARESPGRRWELLGPHLHDPRWHEPLLLCAGQLGVIERRDEEVDELVGRILGADSEHEEALHRDLFLATAVLAEGGTRSKTRLSDILAQLEALRTARVPSVRQQALTGMARLMQLGHEPAKDAFLAWVDERPDAEEILRVLTKWPHGAMPAELRDRLFRWLRSPELRAAAKDALRAMDDSDGYIRRTLLSLLADEEPHVWSTAVLALGDMAGGDGAMRQLLLSRLEDEEPDVRGAAAKALGALVGNDGYVRQALLARLTDEEPDVRSEAVLALRDVAGSDGAVRQALLSRLADETSEVREWAVVALSSMVGNDGAVRQALLARLADESSDVRCAAVEALGPMVDSDEAVRQALLSRLTDELFAVRRRAAKALGPRVGSDEAVRRALLARLADKDHDVRRVAVETLGARVGSDGAVRQALLSRLTDKHPGVREKAAEALRTVVGTDGDVRQALLPRLADEDPEVRERAAEALGTLVGSDESVRQVLLSRLGGEHRQVLSEAVEVLGTLVGSDESVRRALLARLDSEDSAVRRAAAKALGAMVDDDGSVRQALLARLDDENSGVRRVAAAALHAVADSDEAVRQALLARLADEDSEVRRAAVWALRAGAGGEGTVWRALLARLDDEDSDVRRVASEALSPMVGSDEAVRQALFARLDDEDIHVLRVAAKALETVVGSDESMRQTLLARLADEDSKVRSAAVWVLGAVVGSDMAVRQAIFARLDDEDSDVRRAAVWALGAVVGSDGAVRQALLFRLTLADEVFEVGRAAANVLGAVAGNDGVVCQALLSRLAHERWGSDVARILGALAVSDDALRKTLLARITDEDWWVRRDVVRVLGSLAVSDGTVREALLARLDDEHVQVRQEVARALGALACNDESVREELLTRLDDESIRVRSEVIKALGAVVGSNEAVRQALLARLDDEDWEVRATTVMTLSEKSPAKDVPLESFIPWLGAVGYYQPENLADKVRRSVARMVALEAIHDERRLKRLLEMVRDPEWLKRRGAAIALMSIPEGPLPGVMPALLGLLEDCRDEGRWYERLETVAVLLNVRDREASEKAIDCAMRALDWGIQPWVDASAGGWVRRTAAELLGRLEPTHRNEGVLQRLIQLLREDDQEQVCDAAYQAALRLIVAPVERR